MEISFGKYAIIDPVVHHFEREPKWYWKIKPVDSGAELDMAKFMVHRRTIRLTDGSTAELVPTNVEVQHREIALTFHSTNIPVDPEKPVEDGGDPVLKSGASVEEVEAMLRKMPQAMVDEIWDAIAEACPGWGNPAARKVDPKNPK